MSSKTTHLQPTIEVCFGPQCSDCGGRELAEELQAAGYRSKAGDCRNQCPHAPLVLVDERMIAKATKQKVLERLNAVQE